MVKGVVFPASVYNEVTRSVRNTLIVVGFKSFPKVACSGE